MRVEFINPFVSATQDVFQMMLATRLVRGTLNLKRGSAPTYEVSGLIGFCGSYQGMVVVSIGRSTAIRATEIMLGSHPEELNSDVVDAIGELTNMIAGAAKSKLEEYKLSIGLPTVFCGKSNTIRFPSASSPLMIPFDCDLGPVCVEVGICETPTT